MHVDEDRPRAPAQLGEDRVGRLERTVDRVHEHAADQIHHRDLPPIGERKASPTLAGRAGRKIVRAQQARLALEIVDDLAVAPDVITRGADVDAGIEQLLAAVRIDAGAAGDVLAVDDNEARLGAVNQLRQQRPHRKAPRFADDVAEEEEIHDGDGVRGLRGLGP